jgi:hypothetical protein
MDSTQATSLGGSIVLDNVAFSGISTANVQDPSGPVLAANVSPVRQWFQGNTYSGVLHDLVEHHRALNQPKTGTGVRTYTRGTFSNPPKKSTALLDSSGNFFSKSRPQYNTYTSSRVASPNHRHFTCGLCIFSRILIHQVQWSGSSVPIHYVRRL